MLAYGIEPNGKVIALFCNDGRTLDTDNWDDATSFLLQPTTDFSVVYNLDKFVDGLTDLLDADLKDKILNGGRILINNRMIYYQPTKVFGINHINFYGLKKYSDTEPDDENKLLELGNKVVNAYKKLGVSEITKLTSPIAVFGEKLSNIPYARVCDLPDNSLPLVDACAKTMTREWRDTFKLGNWNKDEITDYDLSAAYPSIVAELPDITNATFFSSETMPQTYSWGEMQGELIITKPLSPFYHEQTDSYPVGNLGEQSITTDELWLLSKYQIGTFKFRHGDFFTLPNKIFYPFKDTMLNLYKARSNDDELVSKIAKGISVGIWGKFAERYEERLGDNFNSIYARMTTSRCIVKVASFIYHNQMENDIVSILVDGLLSTKRLQNVSIEKKMGQWRMNEFNPALVLSTLYQWIGDKKPAMLTYGNMTNLISEKPNNHIYGDVDLNLITHSRKFKTLPRTGKELLENKYSSDPIKA